MAVARPDSPSEATLAYHPIEMPGFPVLEEFIPELKDALANRAVHPETRFLRDKSLERSAFTSLLEMLFRTPFIP